MASSLSVIGQERSSPKRGYDAGKIQVVHPSLPTSYERIPLWLLKQLEGRPFTLLTVSRLDATEQYKGQDHVIEALHRFGLTEPKLRLKYINTVHESEVS